jgi:hypothetical protein
MPHMPRKSKAQLAKEALEVKKALTPKEIRLNRRKAEKQKMGIVTDIPNYQEFKIKSRITGSKIQEVFAENIGIYIPLVTKLIASQMAMATSIHNVMEAVKELHPDVGTAEELHASIDKAWDLATTSLILEAAFTASGYAEAEARAFAQSIMLRREEPRPIHIKPPEQAKKPPDIEALVKEVGDKLGVVMSREKKKEHTAPTRRERKQA